MVYYKSKTNKHLQMHQTMYHRQMVIEHYIILITLASSR
jgi:hypothetical protein